MENHKNFNYYEYINNYDDIRFFSYEDALKHYIEYGKAEGRTYDTNNLAEFNYYEYINNYDDIRFFSYEDALKHYIEYGKAEGRVYNTNNLAEFNYYEYINNYDDIRFFSYEDALKHYIEYGKAEGRVYNTNNLADFDPSLYRNKYMDLQNMTDDDIKLHYIQCGKYEARQIYKLEKTKVLIVLPTYNRSYKCINVINNILNQTYKNFDLLIIDDGSDLLNYNIIKNYVNIRSKINSNSRPNIIVQQNDKNMKIPKTLNIGIEYFLNSDYDCFTWISDDNIYFSNFISTLVSSITSDVDFVYTNVKMQDQITNSINEKYGRSYADTADLINNFIGIYSFMWSKCAIKKIGLYNDQLFGVEDFDYFIRTFRNVSNIKYLPVSTMEYVFHSDSLYFKKFEDIYAKTNDIKLIYNKLESNDSLFIYYSKVQWSILFQRPHQICRFFNNSFLKIFITCENIIKFEEKYNLLIIPYYYRNLIFNFDKLYDDQIIYYTDPRLYEEITKYTNANTHSNYSVLFDLIDAPINEFAVWKPNLENSVKSANLVIYSHPKLVEYLNKIEDPDKSKKYYYISNGCDYEHFSKAKNRIGDRPIDFPNTDKPILGYYGAFAEWLDYDLIKTYAYDGKYHIIMIGGLSSNPSYNIRFDHPNITWLDHKPYEELPYYLSWFDKCFLPFKKCKLTKYVNPCKLWEYMASEKEIIKHGINIDSNELVKYEDICIKILNIIDIYNKYINLKTYISIIFDDIPEKYINKIYNTNFSIKEIINKLYNEWKLNIDNKFKINFNKKLNINYLSFKNIYELNYNYLVEINKDNLKFIEYKKPTIIIFSMIDYFFRIQRNQHLARLLAENKYQVFYLKTEIKNTLNDFNENKISENLYEINLYCNTNRKLSIYSSVLTNNEIDGLIYSIKDLQKKYNFNHFISYISNSFWYQVVEKINNTSVIFDCLDYTKGFNTHDDLIIECEDRCINENFVIFTSPILKMLTEIKHDNYTYIRNACDFEYFNSIKKINNNRKIIGYYGTISDWFDIDLVEKIVNTFIDCDIHLIGAVWCQDKIKEKRINQLKNKPNVKIFGEIPYNELKDYLNLFDIGIIPFVINDLIKCTNPVKLYEMLSMGLSIIMTDLNDVHTLGRNELYYLSKDHDDFIENIKIAFNDNNLLKEDRIKYAKENTWRSRYFDLIKVINKVSPLISIVLLCWNHWEQTKKCIDSIILNSNYDNYEIIIVNNNSTDNTKKELEKYKIYNNVNIVNLDKNYGFAKGMNTGALYANGEYIILLNNDTIVSEDWLYPLIKPLITKKYNFGSPITNNCGNEVKQFIYHNNIDELLSNAKILQKNNNYKYQEIDRIPFFSPVVRKKDFFSIGMLDVNFGRGGWEDDDLLYKIKLYNNNNNYFTYGSFVYHIESLSMGGAEYYSNNDNNKNYYETKWNTIWIPPKFYFKKIKIKLITKNNIINNLIVNDHEKYTIINNNYDLCISDYIDNNHITISENYNNNDIIILENHNVIIIRNDKNKYILDKGKWNNLNLYTILNTINNRINYNQ
jgi:GT2 family glycosyltransferase